MARSILDTDLYKLTMQNAVRMLYPEAKATYRFTNRAKGMRFNSEAFEYIKKAIKDMDQMRLTPEEKKWLRRTCPYFPADYLDWLLDFQLDSDKQVRIIFNKDDDSEFGELDIASMLGACQKQGSPLIAIPFPQSKGSGLR
jgi:nicotinate phosphoribosyltransferase